jgi:hypothetical protein
MRTFHGGERKSIIKVKVKLELGERKHLRLKYIRHERFKGEGWD